MSGGPGTQPLALREACEGRPRAADPSRLPTPAGWLARHLRQRCVHAADAGSEVERPESLAAATGPEWRRWTQTAQSGAVTLSPLQLPGSQPGHPLRPPPRVPEVGGIGPGRQTALYESSTPARRAPRRGRGACGEAVLPPHTPWRAAWRPGQLHMFSGRGVSQRVCLGLDPAQASESG